MKAALSSGSMENGKPMDGMTAREKRIREIAGSWEIGGIRALTDLHIGNVYKVELDGGSALILKNIGKDTPQIRERFVFEQDVLRHLESRGIPVALPMLRGDGETFIDDEGALYTLSPFLAASDSWKTLAPEGLGRLHRECGAAIARLGAALAAFPCPDIEARTWKTEFARDLRERWIPDVERGLDAREGLLALETIKAALEGADETIPRLPLQLIHRDCHIGNVVVHGEKVSGFIDFDHLSLGPRAFDLVYFIAHMIMGNVWEDRTGKAWLPLVEAVLEGYETVTPITADERASFFHMIVGMFVMYSGWFFELGKKEEATTRLRELAWVLDNRDELKKAIFVDE